MKPLRRKFSILLFIAVLMVSLSPSLVNAVENKWDEWVLYSPIETDGDSKYKAIYLTEEVYEHSLLSLADLRLIDKNGDAVPYYIQQGQKVVEENEITHQTTLIATEHKNNDTKLDYKVEPIRQGTDIRGNMLLFALPEQNFLKHLMIHGSYDGNQWEFLNEDFIYRTEQLTKNKVSLNNTYKYSYYRVTILDNAEQIRLPKLQLIYQEENEEWQRYEKIIKLNYEISEEDKTTVVTLDNSHHLRMKEIHFTIEGNFQRAFTIYDSNNQWIRSDEGQELYNLHFKDMLIANKSILFDKHPVSTDQLTIKIKNHDNPPLSIQDISVEYYIDKIVFEDKGLGPYKLYFGNAEADAPNYDIRLFQSYIEKEKQDIVMLEKVIANQDKEMSESALPSWLNEKMIFNIVVIFISLMLIILLMKKLNNK